MKPNFENYPPLLLGLDQWVNFCLEERDGRKTKVLKIPGKFRQNGEPMNAKPNKPETFRSFEAARKAYVDIGKTDGLGFVPTRENKLVFIDLDPIDQNAATVQEIIRMFSSITYVERSVSGLHYHIVCGGDISRYLPEGGAGTTISDTGMDLGIEDLGVFRERKFFTFTGDLVSVTNVITNCQEELDWLYVQFPALNKSGKTSPIDLMQWAGNVSPYTDEEVVAALAKYGPGTIARTLYFDGDMSKYPRKDNGDPDQSRADLALMDLLAFHCWGDPEQMRRVFSESALGQRDKWQNTRSYQDRTIAKALAGWNGKRYDPATYAKELALKELAKDLPDEFENERALKRAFFHKHSDADRAKAYLSLFPDRWLCAFGNRRNGTLYRFTGQKWAAAAEAELFNSISNTMELLRARTSEFVADPDAQRKLEDYLTKCCNSPKIISTMAQVKNKVAFDCNGFDTYPYLLNLPGGTLDLQQDKIFPHAPCDYLSQITATDPAEDYRRSLFFRLISESVKDPPTLEWLQVFLGYSLSGDISAEKFLILFGEGGQGKGTIISAIVAALGDYVCTLPFNVMMVNRHKSNGEAAESQMAKLKGKRLAFLAEGEAGAQLNVSKLKTWTGGDVVTARNLYEDATEWIPTTKFIFHTNNLPVISDSTDTGLRRRAEFIKFDAGVTEQTADPTLKAKLLCELPHVLSFLLAGWKMFQSLGGLPKRTAAMQTWWDQFFSGNDLIAQWLADECETGEGFTVQMTEAKDNFNRWLTGGKAERVRLQEFKALMIRHGFQLKQTNKGNMFLGVRIRESEILPKNFTP